MKCNMCTTGEMIYSNMKGTHIYSCEDCPNVQFEYENEKDLKHLREYLDCLNVEGLRILPMGKQINQDETIFKFQIINPNGKAIVLIDEHDSEYTYYQIGKNHTVYGSDSLEYQPFYAFDLQKELNTPQAINYKQMYKTFLHHSNSFETDEAF